MAKTKGKGMTTQHPVGAETDTTAKMVANSKEKAAATLKEPEDVPVHWEEINPGIDPPTSAAANPQKFKGAANAATCKTTHQSIHQELEGVAVECPYEPEPGNETAHAAADKFLSPHSRYVIHERGFETSHPVNAGAAILEMINQPPKDDRHSFGAASQQKSYQAVLGNNHEPPDFVQNSAASSSGNDRFQADILRSMHPLRKEIVGASDNIFIDSEHSSVDLPPVQSPPVPGPA